MKLLVFGSRYLTVRHLPAMRRYMLAEVLVRAADGTQPIPLEWVDEKLVQRVPHEARFRDEDLVLIHGDGPPGKPDKVPGAIGADKLAVVAASLEWPAARRYVRTFGPIPRDGETWRAAAMRRNGEMVQERPDRALCFHLEARLGSGSADTGAKLHRMGQSFRVVLLDAEGLVLKVEERAPKARAG